MTIASERDCDRLLLHINDILQQDRSLLKRLPLTTNNFAAQCRDGIILCKLINFLVPGAIPSRVIQEDMSDVRKRHFFMIENQELVVRAAKSLGCVLVNIAAVDLVNGEGKLLHSLLWQVVKNGTMKRATEKLQHALSASRTELGADKSDAAEQVVESSLVRWINMTLGWTETKEAIADLRRSLADGIVYGKLLNSLFPEHFDGESFATLTSDGERAQAVVETGKKILGSRCILETEDILRANETMNTLFLAGLCRLITEEAGSVAPVSRHSSITSLTLVHEQVEIELRARVNDLERENESLCRRLESMDSSKTAKIDAAVQVEDPREIRNRVEIAVSTFDSANGITDKISAEDDDIPTTDIIPHLATSCTLNRGSCAASDGTRSASSMASGPLGVLFQDSVRLRRIYEQSKDLKSLLRVIYENDIGAYRLAESATLTGTLTRRGGWGMGWNPRFAVIKDNFMLFYRHTTSSTPKEVERLDDCLVKVVEDVTSVRGKEYPVLSVEVSSKVNPHYFYISADAESIRFWRAAINKTSTWWNMKRFE